jgi:membrane protease YdiL (CAAX protease family)
MGYILKGEKRFLISVVFYAFVYFLFVFVVTGVLLAFPELTQTIDGEVVLTAGGAALQNFINYTILFVGIFWFLKADILGDFKDYFVTKKRSVFKVLLVGLGFVAFSFVTSAIVGALNTAFEIPPSANQSFLGVLLQSEFALLFAFMAIVLGPVVEEMIFRKALFSLIHNPIYAVIFSAVLFMVIHLGAEPTILSFLVNGLGYLIPGVIFGLLYLRYNKNIAPLMVIHILNNLISVLLTLLQLSLVE